MFFVSACKPHNRSGLMRASPRDSVGTCLRRVYLVHTLGKKLPFGKGLEGIAMYSSYSPISVSLGFSP